MSDTTSGKSDGRKEKEVAVRKRLIQCARCDGKVCNSAIFENNNLFSL